MIHRDNQEYGLSFDDETDGPDVVHARAALDQSRAETDEIDVIVQESLSLTSDLLATGVRNHFVDKWKMIIVKGGAA